MTTEQHDFSELYFLAKDAHGLDLTDPEDRAIFRMRVADATKNTRVDAMREWINSNLQDRFSVTRAVADLYIAEKLKGHEI